MFSPARFGSRLAIAAVAAACLATAAGCSSSSSTPAVSGTVTVTASPSAPAASSSAPVSVPSSPAGTPAVAGAAACPTSVLHVKLGLGQGYAGGTYQVIDFTNTASTSCTLLGYPGVSLVSGPAPYRQIGLAAKRSTTTPVKLITLAPGATANALLQIVDALNFPASSCGPVKATDLRVYPPNQKAPVYLASAAEGCTKSGQGLFIGAVAAGSGGNS